MAYNQDQPQRPVTNKLQLSDEQAAAIAQLTIREGWLEFTVEDIKLIAEDFPPCPASTAMLDFKKFIYLCSQKGMNPILGDLHFEYHGDKRSATGVKGVAVVHQQAELKLASRTGLLDGIHQEDGSDERGMYVITRVYKKGAAQQFYFKAYHNEFVQSTGFLWPKSPYNMTAKCSRVGCLRIAFPELSGLIGEAEVDDGFSFQATPEAAPATIAIGEKKVEPIAPTPVPVSIPAPPAPKPAPAPDPKPVPDADTNYANQYKTRLAVLIGKDSAYAKNGLTKAQIDGFLLGYFGVENKTKLQEKVAPKEFPPALDALTVALAFGPATFAALAEDPITFGFNLSPKPPERIDQDVVSPSAVTEGLDGIKNRIDAIKKEFKWAEPLAVLAEKLLSKEGIKDLDIFKKMIDTTMPKFTEPQLTFAFTIAYYNPESLAKLLTAFKDPKNKLPLSGFYREIEKRVGTGLDSLEADPIKVAEAVEAVIK